MKRLFLSLFSFFFLIPCHAMEQGNLALKTAHKTAKKRVVVFSSLGGGGQTVVSNTTKKHLEAQGYDVLIVRLMDVLMSFDTLNTLSGGNCQGEDFYNFVIKNNYKGLLNASTSFGAQQVLAQTDGMVQVIAQYLKAVSADMVISTVPVFTKALIKATEQRDIPLIVISTDLDSSYFVLGVDSPMHKKFNLFLAFEDADMRKKIESADIPQENIVISGFPVSPNFIADKNPVAIKDEFNIPGNKPVVMLMFGAQGSKACLKFAEQLATSKVPLHMIICIGKSEHLRLLLENIKSNEHVSRNIIGFTDRVADLMEVSDMLFIKPGSVSVCEGIYSKKPVFLDATPGEDSCIGNNGLIAWEAFNPEFVKKNGLGDVVTDVNQINPMVEKFVTDKSYSSMLKQNLLRLNKVLFGAVLVKSVHALMSHAAGKPVVRVMNK